jgi:hypothetical protein
LSYYPKPAILPYVLFLVTAAILNGCRAVGHNFEREPPRDHPCQVWFNLVQRFQRRRFKYDLKIEKRGDEILIVHCCFSVSQNELKFELQLHDKK